MKLRELWTDTISDREAAVNENRKLKELLRAHGIAYPDADPTTNGGGSVAAPPPLTSFSFGQNPSPPASATHSQATTPGIFGTSDPQQQQFPSLDDMPLRQQVANAPDYGQVAVEFVLASVPSSSRRPHRRRRGGGGGGDVASDDQ